MYHQQTDYFAAQLSIEEPWSAHRVDGLDQAALAPSRKKGETGTLHACNWSPDDKHLQSVQQQVQAMFLQEHQLPLRPTQHQLQREAALHWLYGGQSHPRAPGKDQLHPAWPSSQHCVSGQQHTKGHGHQVLKAEMAMLRHQNQWLLQRLSKVLTDSREAQQENHKKRKVMTAASAVAVTAAQSSKPYCAEILQIPAAGAAAAGAGPSSVFAADHSLRRQQQQQQQQQNKQEIDCTAAVASESSSKYGSCGACAAPAGHAVGNQPPNGAPSITNLDLTEEWRQNLQTLKPPEELQQHISPHEPSGQQPATEPPSHAQNPRICLNLDDEPMVQLQQQPVSNPRHEGYVSRTSRCELAPELTETDQPDVPSGRRTSGLRLDLTGHG